MSGPLLVVLQLAIAPTIGVGETSAQPCIAMAAPPLAAGTVVTLVTLTPPQSSITGVVEATVQKCSLSPRVDGPYYRIRLRSKTLPEAGTLWVAFNGDLPTRRTSSGAISVSLSTAYPDVQVRDCTSSEGVHLTAWAGEPLESRRLWRAYYYLGFDVEPSCSKGEVEDNER